MTEAEWLLCSDPLALLDFVHGRGGVSDRQLRLFAVACSRRVWDRLDDLGRAAVMLAEQFADGRAGPEELRAARLACRTSGASSSWYAAASRPFVAARNAALSAQSGAASDEREAQADLLRDVIGNPFRPLSAWKPREESRVMMLAREMYEEGDFSPPRFGLLADALHEAGCTDEELLAHGRRQPALHCRGCFLIDLLRGPHSAAMQ